MRKRYNVIKIPAGIIMLHLDCVTFHFCHRLSNSLSAMAIVISYSSIVVACSWYFSVHFELVWILNACIATQ